MQTSGNEAKVRVRVRRNPQGAVRKLVLLLITIYVAFVAYRFVHDLVVIHLAEIKQVPRGIIQAVVPAQGILLRNEQTVIAPRTGLLKVLIPDGERVRVGQVIAQVVTTSLNSRSGEKEFNITAPRAGLVSYHLDGLEEIYSIKNINELDLEKVQTIKSQPKQVLAGNKVEEGKPFCKILNNLDPLYIVAELSGQFNIETMEKGESVLLSLDPDEKDIHRAVLVEKNYGGSPDRIILSLGNYPKDMTILRKVSFKIITERYEGYYVPFGAIVRKEGKDGIYTIYKETVRWKGIEIRGRVDENVAIKGVTPDMEVIFNPTYVKEGFSVKIPFRM